IQPTRGAEDRQVKGRSEASERAGWRTDVEMVDEALRIERRCPSCPQAVNDIIAVQVRDARGSIQDEVANARVGNRNVLPTNSRCVYRVAGGHHGILIK